MSELNPEVQERLHKAETENEVRRVTIMGNQSSTGGLVKQKYTIYQ